MQYKVKSETKTLEKDKKYLLCGLGIMANCMRIGPGPVAEMTFVGVFLRNPGLNSSKFWRKPWKTPND